MIYLIVVLLALVCAALLYALAIRPWLKGKPWSAGFFALIEPLERNLFKKSETILVGRLLWVGGLAVTLYDSAAIFLSSLDLTPVTTRLFDMASIPPDMRGLVATALLAALGRLITWLRARTSKPLEVVSVAPKDVTGTVAQAIAMADATRANAVAAVQEAKAA